MASGRAGGGVSGGATRIATMGGTTSLMGKLGQQGCNTNAGGSLGGVGMGVESVLFYSR